MCVSPLSISSDVSDVWIETPNDHALEQLQLQLADLAPSLDELGAWPHQQLQLCANHGVFRWFVPQAYGGAAWSAEDIVRGYLKLSAGCLTTTFIITQYTGAARRIASSDNIGLQQDLLPKLATGKIFGTVGISHLTTSRRHLNKNILRAAPASGGYRLTGLAPWVTGSPQADLVVVGATLDDGRQLLATVSTALPGVHVPPPANLVALSASQTGPVHFDDCFVANEFVIAGPMEEVMKQGAGAGTGGVQTSTLAIGLAQAAIGFLQQESCHRPELLEATEALRGEVDLLEDQVLRMAAGEQVCSNEELRIRANSLALRSAQASLSAAKGTGYVIGHPAGRWCREALFFLVWSCPQPVMAANLCELAGLTE